MRAWVIVLCVAACGSKKTEQAPAPLPVAKTGSGSGSGSAGHAKPPPPTKEQRAEFRKRMKAGWALQKDSKWAEAVPEFEAALVAMPGDQRALTELGFSAMNAGDFVKARKADQEAILVAVDKKVEAAGLYNLGLVLQKSGDTDGARKSFTQSLALRANKTVEQALASLGAAPGEQAARCDPAKPCPCALDVAFGELLHDDSPVCEPSKVASPVPGFKVIHVGQNFHGWDAEVLFDEHGQPIDVIGGGVFYGRHDEDIMVEKAEIKTTAGHRVLWLQTTDDERTTLTDDSDDDAMGFDTYSTTLVTLCLVGDAKTPTTCPLSDVPIVERFDHEPPKGKTESTETTADLAIADDGTATVKLIKGASDPRLDRVLGPTKLW